MVHLAGMEKTKTVDFEIKRWSIFLIVMLNYILMYFHRMALGVVSKFLMEILASPKSIRYNPSPFKVELIFKILREIS